MSGNLEKVVPNSILGFKNFGPESLLNEPKCKNEYGFYLIRSSSCFLESYNLTKYPLLKGEVLAVGPNLPHRITINLDKPVKDSDTANKMVSLIYFERNAIMETLLNLHEMQTVKAFLQKSFSLLKFPASHTSSISSFFNKTYKSTGVDRIILLMNLLKELTTIDSFQSVLKETDYSFKTHSSIQKVLAYISSNFDKAISLDDVAAMTNLNRYAFCRYFKQTTNKSFINYLTEVRIKMACRLLHSSQYNISQVCFTTGFNTLSHFNKQFKRIMNCTPTRYRELYRQAFKID